MDEVPLACLAGDDLVDLQGGGDDVVVLRVGESGHLLGLLGGEVHVGGLQLGGAFDEGLGELLSLLHLMSGLETEVLGLDLAGLQPVEEGSCGVVPADHFERNEVILGVPVDLGIIADNLHALDIHPVLGGLGDEVVVDSLLGQEVEPVLGGPAQGLSLVRDHRRNDLVENGDVVGVGELEGVVVDRVDFFDLAGHDVLHAAVIDGDV